MLQCFPAVAITYEIMKQSVRNVMMITYHDETKRGDAQQKREIKKGKLRLRVGKCLLLYDLKKAFRQIPLTLKRHLIK